MIDDVHEARIRTLKETVAAYQHTNLDFAVDAFVLLVKLYHAGEREQHREFLRGMGCFACFDGHSHVRPRDAPRTRCTNAYAHESIEGRRYAERQWSYDEIMEAVRRWTDCLPHRLEVVEFDRLVTVKTDLPYGLITKVGEGFEAALSMTAGVPSTNPYGLGEWGLAFEGAGDTRYEL